MPLHRSRHERETTGADLYSTRATDRPLPKLRVPAQGVRPDVAFGLVRDELGFDGNARQNLATSGRTWLEDEVHRLMDQAIAYFDKHPMARPSGAEEGSSDPHGGVHPG